MLRSTLQENQSLLVSVSLGLLAGVGLGWAAAKRGTHPADAPAGQKDVRRHFDQVAAADRAARSQRAPANNADAAADDAFVTSLTFRPATGADVAALGQQWFDSYNQSAAELGAPILFPTVASATALVQAYVESKVGLVAVTPSGEVVASAFNDESDVATSGNVSCGPWTTEYARRNRGVGHALISRLVSAAIERGAKTLRLLQGPTNLTSYAAYVRMGFQVREHLTYFSGQLDAEVVASVLKKHSSWHLAEWTDKDVPELDALWSTGTGYSRAGTLTSIGSSSARRAPRYVLRDRSGGRVLAFTTGFGSMGSSAAVSEEAFKHLICAAANAGRAQANVAGAGASVDASSAVAAPTPAPLSMHIPIRLYPELNRFLLDAGLRVGRTAHLMVCGEWKPIDREGFFYAPSTELS